MNKKLNSNSSAGTPADSSTQPRLQRQAKLLANPMLCVRQSLQGNDIIEFVESLSIFQVPYEEIKVSVDKIGQLVVAL